jgi:hypothetical protein
MPSACPMASIRSDPRKNFPTHSLNLHMSYDHIFQTPSFENILLSSSPAAESFWTPVGRRSEPEQHVRINRLRRIVFRQRTWPVTPICLSPYNDVLDFGRAPYQSTNGLQEFAARLKRRSVQALIQLLTYLAFVKDLVEHVGDGAGAGADGLLGALDAASE